MRSEIEARMERGLREILALLDGYSESEMQDAKDDQGWNIRDHVTHLATWADGIAALLQKQNRWAAMGLDMPEPDSEPDYDALNAEQVVQHRHLSAAAARDWLVAAHRRVEAAMGALTDEELDLPYERYVTPFTGDGGKPVSEYILGNTEDHYEEHTPWIRAIS